MIFFEKWRKSLRGTRLPDKIECRPSEMTVKDANEYFKQVDDKKIIRDNTLPWYFYTVAVVILFATGLEIYSDDIKMLSTYIFSGVFFFSSVATIIYAVVMPKKIVIFDRLKGEITIGGPHWVKPIIVPFKDVKAFMRTEYTYLTSDIVLNIYRPDLYKQDVAFWKTDFDALASDWAFYLWYMDKTRELPPGDAFDEYRVDDAKRRQREQNAN